MHGVFDDIPLANGNTNGIGLVVRDHDGNSLWGIMGPLQGMEGFQYQLWAIHLAMKLAFVKQIPHVRIETDNIQAYNMLVDHDEEVLEAEGLVVAAQQISVLHAEYNKVRSDKYLQKTCRILSVFGTKNGAPTFLA